MTQDDFSALATKLPDFHRGTISNLSKSDQGVQCLDSQWMCSLLDAIGFDKVKEDWYDETLWHQVRSADVLYKHGDRYYLIEFKTGKIDNVDIHRKLYDSVIGILEHNVLTLADCRKKVQYVIVAPQYATFRQHRDMLHHFQYGVSEPWEYAVTKENLKQWDRNDIRKLSGFLVDRIYKLSPDEFKQFAKNRNWSN